MARTRVVVDPITRIEGHLRIEAQAENGRIANAWATSTQFRGIEIVMQGRDPRDAWAFTQRICGVCTVVHAVASCRAVEDALDITIPPNANLIRNLIHGMQYVQDHVIHFYHLHALDWVDVVSALKADPAGTAAIARKVSPWPNNSETYFRAVQDRLKKFVAGGQLGIFANGYWGHPAYKLPPEVNLLAVAHYLEALDWQRDVIRLHTIFGGKNPHPNFLDGRDGVRHQPGRHRDHQRRAADRHPRHDHPRPAVRGAGVLARHPRHRGLLQGMGVGGRRGARTTWRSGEFPDGDVRETERLYLPRGIVLERDLTRVWPYDQEQIKEYITSSWYEYSKGDDAGLHPYEGETKPKYAGPPTPWKYLQDSPKYTWMKAPRYDGEAHGSRSPGAGAGGLRRRARGHPGDGEGGPRPARGRSGSALLDPRPGRGAGDGDRAPGPPDERVVRPAGRADQERRHQDASTASEWSPDQWPAKAQGYGFLDAPRGALGHWVQIENGKISRYQCVVPSTWNCSPRDAQGQMGPYEAALVDNHPLLKPDQPLEILRTIHSFDPCMACGVHVLDVDGNLITEVTVQ